MLDKIKEVSRSYVIELLRLLDQLRVYSSDTRVHLYNALTEQFVSWIDLNGLTIIVK